MFEAPISNLEWRPCLVPYCLFILHCSTRMPAGSTPAADFYRERRCSQLVEGLCFKVQPIFHTVFIIYLFIPFYISWCISLFVFPDLLFFLLFRKRSNRPNPKIGLLFLPCILVYSHAINNMNFNNELHHVSCIIS